MPNKSVGKTIGYCNPFEYPVSISFGGQQTEILPKAPVVGKNGKLVIHDDHLEALVQSNILRRIPEDHPDYRNHDLMVEKRQQRSVRSYRDEGAAPRDNRPAADPEVTTVISSQQGLTQTELPEGAHWVDKGDRKVISYDGRTFTSISSLNVYRRSLMEGDEVKD